MLQTMISWVQTHPYLAGLLVWAMAMCLLLIPFLIRGSKKPTGEPHPWFKERTKPDIRVRVEDRMSGPLRELQLSDAMRLHRVPMHSRFVPDTGVGRMHADAMVDQIIGDQQIAHEEPGKATRRAAPGEPYYQPPGQRIRVVVGPYTVILDRARPTGVSEARPDGAEWPVAEVPEHWEPVVIALAMEVQRLREGWSHPSDTPAP